MLSTVPPPHDLAGTADGYDGPAEPPAALLLPWPTPEQIAELTRRELTKIQKRRARREARGRKNQEQSA